MSGMGIGMFFGASAMLLVLFPLLDAELRDGNVKTPWGEYECTQMKKGDT